MRLVLDTNVLLAAFLTHGSCNELLEHCAIRHEVVTSRFILSEMKDKLVNKFAFSPREANEAIRLLTSRFVRVTPHRWDCPQCRDADDDFIIGTAWAGQCECIVTGDKDLLSPREAHGIRIVSPSDFWALEKRMGES